jgi:hypothetical protein
MEVAVFSPQDRELNDEQILTFWQLVFSPDQLRWSPDDSQDLASWDDQRVLQFYRGNLGNDLTNLVFWAARDNMAVLRWHMHPKRTLPLPFG